MNRPSRLAALGVAGTLAAALLAVTAAGLLPATAIGDDDEHERGERGEHGERGERGERGGWGGADIAPVRDTAWTAECGSCHFAYQPGLLPAADWGRILSADGLAAHYGDDATLDEPLRARLAAYAEAQAADRADRPRSRAFGRDAGFGADLPRITATAYFVRKHDEVPARLVVDNPEVGSFSQCQACHQHAADGNYNENGVRIPGFGRWDD